MPSLSTKTSASFVKLMMVGESGSGKTGALASLAIAGYKLRIFDFDNGIEPLKNEIEAVKPAALSNVEYMTFRDSYKMGPTGPMLIGGAKAYPNAARALDKWEDGTVPAEWGADHICVIDSLTFLGRATLAWATSMNPGAKEPRTWYNVAQDAILTLLAGVTSEAFKTNLIVLTHIDMREETGQAYPSSIGKAIGDKIPAYFNTFIAIEKSGMGVNVKRTIRTLPTASLSLKNAAPRKVEPAYPIETGLATIFSKLSGKA